MSPPSAPAEEEAQEGLTFTEHLEELRRRLIFTILGLVVGTALAFGFAEELFHLLMVPVLEALPEGQQELIYTSALEKFFVYLRVAVYAGLFLGAPNFLFQLWRFIAPGLYKNERRLVWPFVVFGTLMFLAGAVFCYLIVLPNALDFLINFGGAADWTRPMLSLKEQLSLVLMLELAFGVVFEIPLIIAFLAMIGLVDAAMLSRYRRHAAVAVCFLAAVITPTGDPFNLALMAIPMYVFYEVGIVLAWFLGRGAKKAEEEAGAE
ncbi:MAG: twin-arginine translocase subunit TatC [Deltaproteobacteria bacterium]|nr:twin-arginine translocase subunit TatC [Deltaproteobacteria bacterium]